MLNAETTIIHVPLSTTLPPGYLYICDEFHIMLINMIKRMEPCENGHYTILSLTNHNNISTFVGGNCKLLIYQLFLFIG